MVGECGVSAWIRGGTLMVECGDSAWTIFMTLHGSEQGICMDPIRILMVDGDGQNGSDPGF